MSHNIKTKLKQAERLRKAGKPGDALVLYRKLLKREPENGELHHAIGRILRDANNLLEAVPYYNKAITLGVRSASVFAELAGILNKLGRYHEADPMARAAVTLEPENPAGLRQLAMTLFAQGQYDQALTFGERVITRSPDRAEDHVLFARINAGAGLYPVTIKHANRAIELDPSSADAWYLLCQAHLNLQNWDEASRMIEQALDLAPDNPFFITMKATVLEYQGQVEEAYALIKPIVENETLPNATAIHLYARLAKRFGKQQHALELLEKLQKVEQLPVSLLNVTLNLLGTTCDELGQYDKAFAAIDKANKIKPHFYNDENHETSTRTIMDWFTRERLQQLPKADHGSTKPIFIVGMPRSGTSLTEKILARHPDVHAGGELPLVLHILRTELPTFLGSTVPFPGYLEALTVDAANRGAMFYLEQIERLATGGEARVTDKMPMNYMFLGLIALLFPEAKIIHCTRDPLATGLSCYFANFADSGDMGFSQDLTTIGSYYKRYEQLMAHWHQVLPMPIYDLAYESLVSSPDIEIPRLLEFCELSWHEDCLSPHKSAQATTTASYNQVRQPINTGSVQRWKHYEKHLAPLKETLGMAG